MQKGRKVLMIICENTKSIRINVFNLKLTQNAMCRLYLWL